MATNRVIVSGFGGQGVMGIGQLLTYAGMFDDKHVSWLPSYGPAMRGGAANCSVIISDEPIGAPNISTADAAIVMNEPSLDKFESYVAPGGHIFIGQQGHLQKRHHFSPPARQRINRRIRQPESSQHDHDRRI